jgi:hypothetical protein
VLSNLEVEYDLHLYAPDGGVLYESNRYGADDDGVTIPSAAPGDYLVFVNSPFGDVSDTPYALQLTMNPIATPGFYPAGPDATGAGSQPTPPPPNQASLPVTVTGGPGQPTSQTFTLRSGDYTVAWTVTDTDAPFSHLTYYFASSLNSADPGQSAHEDIMKLMLSAGQTLAGQDQLLNIEAGQYQIASSTQANANWTMTFNPTISTPADDSARGSVRAVPVSQPKQPVTVAGSPEKDQDSSQVFTLQTGDYIVSWMVTQVPPGASNAFFASSLQRLETPFSSNQELMKLSISAGQTLTGQTRLSNLQEGQYQVSNSAQVKIKWTMTFTPQ